MHKKVLIDSLLYPAYNICSNYSSPHQEINYLKTVWQKIRFRYYLQTNVFKSFWISYLSNTVTKI